MDLVLEIQKTIAGMKISVFQILSEFCGRNFNKLSPNAESATPRYHLYQF